MTLTYAIPTESAIIASVTESKGSFKKNIMLGWEVGGGGVTMT